jgi:hypothetical protein
LGSTGALLCFLKVGLLGFGRSMTDGSGDPRSWIGEIVLSDFDVGLI